MDLNFWKGKRVLITGNSGFKGSWLCMILSRLGATIIGYSIPQPVSKPCLYELAKVKDLLAKVYLDDIRLEYMVQVAVCESNPEIVFHMAAQTIVKDGFRDPLGTFETNVLGTANLLQACKMADNVRSTVIITTDKVYDLQAGPWGYREIDPLGAADPYSTSKACSELVAKCYATYEMGDMPIVTARAGNVIGGGDFSYRLMPMLVRWLNNGTVPVIWDPTAVRPWQYVLDCLMGYMAIAEDLYHNPERAGNSWNVGPAVEEYATCLDVANAVCAMWPPYLIKPTIGQCPDTYPIDVLLRLDSSKLRQSLNWKPKYNTQAAINSTVRWYQEFYAGGDVPKTCEWYLKDYGL